MTIQEFIKSYNVGFKCQSIDKRPDNMMDVSMRHFKCYLRNDNKSSMLVYFSQGSAHTKDPTCSDVLTCLACDFSGIDQDFEDWARDLGYDPDSRSAEKVYKAILKQYERFAEVFGAEVTNELTKCELD